MTKKILVWAAASRKADRRCQHSGCQILRFFAWWVWRTIYLIKLPRIEKKLRAALDRTLDLLFSKDIVQFSHEARSQYLSYTRQGQVPSSGSRERRQPSSTEAA